MSAIEEYGTEMNDLSEFIGEVKEGLIWFLFWPIATETDRGVNVVRVGVMEKVDNVMVSVGVRSSTVVVVRVEGKTSGLLDESGEIILPVEAIGGSGRWKVDTKSESVGAPLVLSRSS